MKALKDLLSGDLYNKVVTELGDKANNLIVGNKGEWIPKQRFDDVSNQVKDYKKQVEDRDKQLSDLQTKTKGNEELTKTIEELKAANEKASKEYQEQLTNTRRDYAVETAIRGAGVRDDNAFKGVKSLLDVSKIKYENDTFTGIEDQVKAIKESSPYFFEPATPPAPTRAGNPISPKPNAQDEFAEFRKVR